MKLKWDVKTGQCDFVVGCKERVLSDVDVGYIYIYIYMYMSLFV